MMTFEDLVAHIEAQTKAFGEYLTSYLDFLDSTSPPPEATPADLIARYLAFKKYVEAQSKVLSSMLRKGEMENIQGRLLDALNKAKANSFATDCGTAYRSVLLTGKVKDRDAYVDWCLDHWENGGGEMLQVGAPQVEALRTYVEANKGEAPPGVETSTFTRVNVRAS